MMPLMNGVGGPSQRRSRRKKWQNLAICSAASHGTGIKPYAGAGLGQPPAGHVLSSCHDAGLTGVADKSCWAES